MLFRSASSEVLMPDDKGREEISGLSSRTGAGPRHKISAHSGTFPNSRTFPKSIKPTGGESRGKVKSNLALSDCPSECFEETLSSLSNPANLLQKSDPLHIGWPLAGILANHKQ